MMTLSDRMKQLKPSATMAVTTQAKKMKAAGEDVIILAAGEPDFPTPEWVKEAAGKAIKENFTRYVSPQGITELREAISSKLKKENNVSYAPEEIAVSCGAKNSLFNLFMALLSERDEVMIPAPYWVSYLDQVRICGGVPVVAQTGDDFKVTAEIIENNITEKTKLLVLNSPNNPTGAVIDRNELKKIADLAIENDLWIISDEVYEKFLYQGENVSIASLNADIRDRTLTVNAVSKTYSMTGWRVGYCAGPAEIIKAVSSLQSQSISSTSSVSQKAALAALAGDQSFIEDARENFRKRRDFVVRELNSTRGVSCAPPEGAFYAFPDISGFMKDDLEFAKQLLEKQKVAVVPGSAFGRAGHVRISYACSMEELEKGMERIRRFCQ